MSLGQLCLARTLCPGIPTASAVLTKQQEVKVDRTVFADPEPVLGKNLEQQSRSECNSVLTVRGAEIYYLSQDYRILPKAYYKRVLGLRLSSTAVQHLSPRIIYRYLVKSRRPAQRGPLHSLTYVRNSLHLVIGNVAIGLAVFTTALYKPLLATVTVFTSIRGTLRLLAPASASAT